MCQEQAGIKQMTQMAKEVKQKRFINSNFNISDSGLNRARRDKSSKNLKYA
jgi:hypothetical protein